MGPRHRLVLACLVLGAVLVPTSGAAPTNVGERPSSTGATAGASPIAVANPVSTGATSGATPVAVVPTTGARAAARATAASRRARATVEPSAAAAPRRARATAAARRARRSRPARLVAERVPGASRPHVRPAMDPPVAAPPTPDAPPTVGGTPTPSLPTAPTTTVAPAPGTPAPDVPVAPVPTSPAEPTTVPAVGIRVAELPSYVAVVSRTTVPAGPVRLQLQNRGEDPHDLFVRRDGAPTVTAYIARTDPGATRTITADLPAGTYSLYCTLTLPVVHADAGMRATLTVG